jgi:exodeoxyribonuclease III
MQNLKKGSNNKIMQLFVIFIKKNMSRPIKIITWNLNGIRAMVKKGLVGTVKGMDPDFFCVQETKAQDEIVKGIAQTIDGYELMVNSAEKKGYSGTAIFSKVKPLRHVYNIEVAENDKEGRVIAAEYENFYLVNAYVPNSGSELKRLGYRQAWDKDMLAYLVKLEQSKPVIFTGDLNVAREPIDLARPKENYNKSAGYTQVEIDGINKIIDAGWVDAFRHFHKDKVQYTFWNARFNARANNMGWRIDYFLVSQKLLPYIKDSYILDQVMGSDHCPIGLEIEI